MSQGWIGEHPGKYGFHFIQEHKHAGRSTRESKEGPQFVFIVCNCQVLKWGQSKTRKKSAAVKGRLLLSYGKEFHLPLTSLKRVMRAMPFGHERQSSKKEVGAAGKEIRDRKITGFLTQQSCGWP